MKQIFVDRVCQHILTHSEAIDWFFHPIREKEGNKEGGVRGVRKPQNRTGIRQKTANRIGFFPEFRNRA